MSIVEREPKILSRNLRHYPTQMGTEGIDHSGKFVDDWAEYPPCVMTVLVEGDIGDYAAYTAVTDDPIWAAKHGNKISFQEAQVHFPYGLKKEKYRER